MNATNDSLDRTGTDVDESDITFRGYARSDGSIGIRNQVLVIPSVICSHVAADRIAAQVEGAKSTAHDHGCAQLGSDNEQTRRTLIGVAQNPNVAGSLLVGLGCEHVRSGDVTEQLDDLGETARELVIQDVGGTDPTIDQGVEVARDLVAGTENGRTEGGLEDVTVGIVSSDLEDGTVSTADPLLGAFVDRVIDAGGRVVAAGVERVVANPEEARSRVRAGAIDDFDDLIERHTGIPGRKSNVRRTAEELDFRTSTRAWGDQPIVEVLDYGELASHDSGLAIVDAPSEFGEAATGLAASGATVIVHVTDEGIPTGHPVSPVIKLTGNGHTYEALQSDLDLNAERNSVSDLGELVESVLDGAETSAESHGLEEFAITRVGPSM
ncbi:MAG: UxaA family hydrolase [Halodesulfurarchaeum sp.]